MHLYDLHVHTNRSDGSMPVEEVVAFAVRRKLAGIAVSDHDTMTAVPAAVKMGEKLGIEIIPAVELSTTDDNTGRKVHLLVYFPQNPEVFAPVFDDMAKKRREAGLLMIELLCRRYPVTPEQISRYYEPSSTIFRVHMLRALLESGFSSSIYGSLYHELFADPGGCCLVKVQYTDMVQAAQIARRSGGAVVLAHPGVYNSFDAGERLARAGLLDGLEYSYPRRREKDLAQHDRLVREYDLIATGGTDFHGFYTSVPNPVGTCTTDAYALERLHKLCR